VDPHFWLCDLGCTPVFDSLLGPKFVDEGGVFTSLIPTLFFPVPLPPVLMLTSRSTVRVTPMGAPFSSPFPPVFFIGSGSEVRCRTFFSLMLHVFLSPGDSAFVPAPALLLFHARPTAFYDRKAQISLSPPFHSSP